MSEPGTTPSTPSTSWPWILLGLGLFGVAVAAWRPIPAGVWHDDGVYMLVGKALAGGHGLVYDGVPGTPPAAKFPPGYPLLLAILWSVFDAIGPVTFAATVLNLGFLAVAGAFFAKALHETAGVPIGLAIAASGLAFASGDVVRTALVPLSESLFLALASGSLVLWGRIEGTGPGEGAPPDEQPTDPRMAVGLLALTLTCAVLTRSAAIALVAAFGVAFLVRRRFAVAVASTGPAVLALVLWSRWSGTASASIDEGARDLLGPYGSWLVAQTVSAPTAFLSGLPSHALGVIERMTALFLPGVTGVWLWLLSPVLVVLVAVGTRRALVRFPPLAWFTLAYFGMLLLWPYLDRRLLVPLHPAVIALVTLAGVDLLARVPGERVRRVAIGVAACWVVGYTAVTAFRIADGWPSAAYRLRADRLAASVEALGQTIPPDGVVGAPEFWAALHLHGGWSVAPSVRFDPRSSDPEAPMWGTPDQQIALWRAFGVEYLLLEQAGQLHSDALDQIEDACAGSVFILAQMPSSLVVRVDWDAACG